MLCICVCVCVGGRVLCVPITSHVCAAAFRSRNERRICKLRVMQPSNPTDRVRFCFVMRSLHDAC